MARRIKTKLVMELRARGMSRKAIARTRKMSMHTVMAVFDAADEHDVHWDDIKELSDGEVFALLFPERVAAEKIIFQPDYDYVHSELKKTGVTLKLLWQEYSDIAREDGSTPVSYTSFTRGYSDYTVHRNVTNHLDHKPGQVMEVDWSGATMRIISIESAEITKAYLFVAVLPYSQYTYVEATLNMKQNAWLACHVNAYEFFGGVALRCVCDNLKTGVISHPKEGEIVLNEAYESLARHYMCAIMPTNIAKPKQKASAEGAVGKIATAVIAALRNEKFFTLEQLNRAIRKRLELYNSTPFQKREGSRKEIFELVERECLAPLPETPYEICEWVYNRSVNLDFHVTYKTNRYSVPHTLIGKKVDLKITDSVVEVYERGTRVASHVRYPDYVRYKPRTQEEHMPPEFVKPEWDDERMRRWANDIGENTGAVIERVFGDVQIKEQAYNPVMAILNLSKTYGERRLEAACAYALLKAPAPRYRLLRSILASGTDSLIEPASPPKESGGYVRGSSYYSSTEGKECS